MMRRLCALAVLVALAVAAAGAQGADSLAPAGAAHNWLPKEGWVWMHWLPFEEPELARALGTTSAAIRSYLSDDDHVLATLASRRHEDVKALARYLTRRFDGRCGGLACRIVSCSSHADRHSQTTRGGRRVFSRTL